MAMIHANRLRGSVYDQSSIEPGVDGSTVLEKSYARNPQCFPRSGTDIEQRRIAGSMVDDNGLIRSGGAGPACSRRDSARALDHHGIAQTYRYLRGPSERTSRNYDGGVIGVNT